ncbi:DEAD/DEAH box helicase [Paenibacillus guangzhouensis]|uniref:DEAD/DEAH box helicase n=1 Tax=Paenibacillus guangzhouensis TaxID=1473112 RepID=UPI001266C5D0|nr:DEAD/DEAH box helicase [Paenibacillus guangzhouensis]
MNASSEVNTLTIHVKINDGGDALIHGYSNKYEVMSSGSLKDRLFAYHEPSFYGTTLTTRVTQDLEFVELPAEYVLSFFAQLRVLQHVSWHWEGDAPALIKLAPTLSAMIDARQYVPSLTSHQAGRLQWEWENGEMEEASRIALKSMVDTDSLLLNGLMATFSQTVFQRHYRDETELTDLRREYPLLFAEPAAHEAANHEDEWLIRIGWKPDTTPFRPLLQLIEPGDDEPAWRLQLMLQDKQDPSLLIPVQLAEDGQAHGEWPEAWTHIIRERSSAWLCRLSAVLTEDQFDRQPDQILGQALSDDDAWQFLTSSSHRLLDAGWQVLLPAWWEEARRKRPRVRAMVQSAPNDARPSLFGLKTLVDFDWRIAIGDMELSEQEFAELAARGERLIQFRGQWIVMDTALLAQIRQAMRSADQRRGMPLQTILQIHLLQDRAYAQPSANAVETVSPEEQIKLEVQLNAQLQELIGQLQQPGECPAPAIPAALQAELRTYQQEGFAWLAFLRRFGFGACLADDMGLGKTVQFIAYLLHVLELAAAAPQEDRFPSLLICPTSVLGNWQKELRRFAPTLNVLVHYGAHRLSDSRFADEAKQADIVLTTYATAALDVEVLEPYTWASVCLDEAQNIKNAQTRQSQAVRRLEAQHRIVMTGTPIENNLSELWSLYDFMNPGYFGTLRSFQHQFNVAVERERDIAQTAELQKLVKPFMLRRKKKDPAIQLDLPDKNEMKTYVHLTAEQGALYDQTVHQLMESMKELEGIERKGAILAALTQLKQLCDHPALLMKEDATKADSEMEGDATMDMESIIARSSKLERLVEMVKELRESGDRCLIFTQYIGMGRLLKRVLTAILQEPVLYLHGGTPKAARDRMIEQFQSDDLPATDQPHVFILSLKAGGVGLNLTAANHVFHFDRWWNPAVENQATDRAYRMGQTRDVEVHKFITIGSLEERIDEMLDHKQALSDQVITSSDNWITELSTEALKDLITLRRDITG